MKLKNKKTGRIYEPPIHCLCGKDYETLAEINEEWEDYEEPKDDDLDLDKACKKICNYFETKATVEEAVEKLKAWKRLKDKYNFRFTGIERDKQGMLKGVKVTYDRKIVTSYEAQNTIKDLMLLFGGEDD